VGFLRISAGRVLVDLSHASQTATGLGVSILSKWKIRTPRGPCLMSDNHPHSSGLRSGPFLPSLKARTVIMQQIASPSSLFPLTCFPLSDPIIIRCHDCILSFTHSYVACWGETGNLPAKVFLCAGQWGLATNGQRGKRGTLIQLHSNRQTVLSKRKVSCLGV
jgi:hypothetical protein